MSRKPDKSPLSRVTQQPAIRHIVAAYPTNNDETNDSTIVKESEIKNDNQLHIATPVSTPINNNSENTNINESVNTSEIVDESKTVSSKNAMNDYIAKNSKKKFEELHTKDTYWVENNVLLTLRELTRGNKGLKTRIINDSLKAFFKKQGIKIVNEE